MKKFDIPEKFRSPLLTEIKNWRKLRDPRKKDFSPTHLDFGSLKIIIPRHMGFCYGVENAIEISYKAIAENPGKNIFLLSQMIHNPQVNADLESLGIRFIMDTEGHQFIPWDEITSEDVVIIPAFGTTVEIARMLEEKGVGIEQYNTTCPFVEKVWKRSSEIGKGGYTVIIHGKSKHEETRATFSHSSADAPSVVIRNMDEAKTLAQVIRGELSSDEFYKIFAGKYSAGFDPQRDLKRIGVVNQTTMLATETQEIADFLKQEVAARYGGESFADTRDTLCYATNDNQDATREVLNHKADLGLVIGGHNSSNTSQLVSILSERMPVFFIPGAQSLRSATEIEHFSYGSAEFRKATGWLPAHRPVTIVVTSGASCPDQVVEGVLFRLMELVGDVRPVQEVLHELTSSAGV